MRKRMNGKLNEKLNEKLDGKPMDAMQVMGMESASRSLGRQQPHRGGAAWLMALALALAAGGPAAGEQVALEPVGVEGSDLVVRVVARDFRSVGAVDVEVQFDPALLDAPRRESSALASGGMVLDNVREPGQYRLAVVHPTGVSGDGEIARLRFPIRGGGSAADLELRATVTDLYGSPVRAGTQGASVQLASAAPEAAPPVEPPPAEPSPTQPPGAREATGDVEVAGETPPPSAAPDEAGDTAAPRTFAAAEQGAKPSPSATGPGGTGSPGSVEPDAAAAAGAEGAADVSAPPGGGESPGESALLAATDPSDASPPLVATPEPVEAARAAPRLSMAEALKKRRQTLRGFESRLPEDPSLRREDDAARVEGYSMGVRVEPRDSFAEPDGTPVTMRVWVFRHGSPQDLAPEDLSLETGGVELLGVSREPEGRGLLARLRVTPDALPARVRVSAAGLHEWHWLRVHPRVDVDLDASGSLDTGDWKVFGSKLGVARGDKGYDAAFDLVPDGVIDEVDGEAFVFNFVQSERERRLKRLAAEQALQAEDAVEAGREER